MAINKDLKDKAQKTREDGVFTLKLDEGVSLAMLVSFAQDMFPGVSTDDIGVWPADHGELWSRCAGAEQSHQIESPALRPSPPTLSPRLLYPRKAVALVAAAKVFSPVPKAGVSSCTNLLDQLVCAVQRPKHNALAEAPRSMQFRIGIPKAQGLSSRTSQLASHH